MSDAINIEEKRRFWCRVRMVSILVVFISLLAMLALYLSGINAAKASAESGLEIDIAVLSARGDVFASATKWTLPLAILGVMALYVSRYKLRKLEKAKNL